MIYPVYPVNPVKFIIIFSYFLYILSWLIKRSFMIIIKTNLENPEPEDYIQIVDTLEKGGVVAMPTDSVYGLICDAENVEAIKRVYQIKERPEEKPFLILITPSFNLSDYVELINERVQKLINNFWPGPLTIIFHRKKGVLDHISEDDSIAIRMPKSHFLWMIIDSVKKPIIAPSANLSNKPPASNAEMVIDNFGDKVDLLVDGGESVEKIPSTIIDVRTFPYKIVRQGIISLDNFQSIYGIEIKN